MNLSSELTKQVAAHIDEVRNYLGTLPADERQEILQSIESHIHDALQSRSGDEPTSALLDAVIAEMDPPESYGELTATPQKKQRRQWLIIVLILVLTALGTTVYLKLKQEKKLPESLTSKPSITTPIIEGVDVTKTAITEKQKTEHEWEQRIENGAVLMRDNQKGLVWPQCPHDIPGNSEEMDWDAAKQWCENLTYAGRSDWRLPQKDELPVVDKHKNKFKEIKSWYYWTSADYGKQSPLVVSVYMIGHKKATWQQRHKTDNSYVLPVAPLR